VKHLSSPAGWRVEWGRIATLAVFFDCSTSGTKTRSHRQNDPSRTSGAKQIQVQVVIVRWPLAYQDG
jgi:hypothetical protein